MPPAKPIDAEKFKLYCRLKPRIEDCAAFFECSEKHIERYCHKTFDMPFKQYRDQQTSKTRHALIQKAIQEGLEGNNTMLIFSLKNMAGWSDRQHLEIEGDIRVRSITDLLIETNKAIDVTPKQIEGDDVDSETGK